MSASLFFTHENNSLLQMLDSVLKQQYMLSNIELVDAAGPSMSISFSAGLIHCIVCLLFCVCACVCFSFCFVCVCFLFLFVFCVFLLKADRFILITAC